MLQLPERSRILAAPRGRRLLAWLHLVIAAHHRAYVRIRRPLEWWIEHFETRALVHDLEHRIAVGFLIVRHVVLGVR